MPAGVAVAGSAVAGLAVPGAAGAEAGATVLLLASEGGEAAPGDDGGLDVGLAIMLCFGALIVTLLVWAGLAEARMRREGRQSGQARRDGGGGEGSFHASGDDDGDD